MTGIDEAALVRIEKQYAGGLSSAQILDVFATHGVPLSEATLRKYVQLGLLPRSVRVGKKGKHQGSQGIYPVRVIREILRIKQMMSSSYTIEQIQRESLVHAQRSAAARADAVEHLRQDRRRAQDAKSVKARRRAWFVTSVTHARSAET